MARYLQQVWDAGGSGFAKGFGALASVANGDAGGYASALDTLSGQSVAAIGYARYLGSQAFAQSTYSCPVFEDASVIRTQSACGWFRVSGSWLSRDASGDDPSFDLNAVTTAVGGQAQLSDGLFLGGALGWETSQLDDKGNRTSVDGDSYLGAVSLKRETGPWTLTGAADLGWGNYDSRRQLTLGPPTRPPRPRPTVFNAGAHFRAAYEIPRGDWYAEPAFDLDLAYVRLDGYTENGGGDFDLEVQGSDTTVLTRHAVAQARPARRHGERPHGRCLRLGRRQLLQRRGLRHHGPLRQRACRDRRLHHPDRQPQRHRPRSPPDLELYATDRVHVRFQYDGSFADGQTENGGQFRVSYLF